MAREAKDAASKPSELAILHAKNLSKTYDMGEIQVHALRSADVCLYRGELMVLLGSSGSGKSTLLNLLGGLDRPSSGEIYFNGARLDTDNEAALTRFRRKNVGFIFQFYNLIPSLTARENVQLVTDIADDAMSPIEALAKVGLESRADHFPSQLSGGEQQRVAIARAIAKRPALLLCDEPTGALDCETGRLVLSVLEDLNRELGTTTAIITHNAPVAAMADRVLRMNDGAISQDLDSRGRKIPARELEW
jgi:putative ABC transport system ATP-binding protein